MFFVVALCYLVEDQIEDEINGKERRRQIIGGTVGAESIVNQIGHGRGEEACGVNDGNENAGVLTLRLIAEERKCKKGNGNGNQRNRDGVKDDGNACQSVALACRQKEKADRTEGNAGGIDLFRADTVGEKAYQKLGSGKEEHHGALKRSGFRGLVSAVG